MKNKRCSLFLRPYGLLISASPCRILFAVMHRIIQKKSADAKLAKRANSRLSMAVNYMEQKTGLDLDRDAERALDSVPGLIVAHWVEAR